MPFNSFADYPMTWRPTLPAGRRPLYLTLAELLERDIRRGLLRPGTKLPPQRELADFLDINVSTISKAFRLAAEKGLLSGAVGSGTFVSYDALSSARLIAPFSARIIDMGATVPESSSYDPALDELRRMLSEPDAARWLCHHADDDPEWFWQKETAAILLSQCGISAPPEQILFSCGGQNGITAVLSALFRPGDLIAVDDHIYPGFKTAAAMFGLHLLPIPMTDNGMDLSVLANKLRAEPIKGLYLIPACQNPTTITMPLAARKEAARLIRDHHLILIEDGTYQLTEDALPAVASFAPHQSVFLMSLSKILSPGLRIGILAAAAPFFGAITDALYSLNVSVTPLMEELASRLIASGKSWEILSMHKEKTKKRDKIIHEYFPAATCLGKETDIFRWLLLPPSWSGDAFAEAALKKGVRVYSASKFAVGLTKPAAAVRLSIDAPASEEELRQGLQILKNLWHSSPE